MAKFKLSFYEENFSWASKKEAREWFRSQRDGLRAGQSVPKMAPWLALMGLRHTERAMIERGVASIARAQDGVEMWVCFVADSKGSVPTPKLFSIAKLFESATKKRLSENKVWNQANVASRLLLAVLRGIVKPDIDREKWKIWNRGMQTCAETGIPLRQETMAADHEHPLTFDFLVREFMETQFFPERPKKGQEPSGKMVPALCKDEDGAFVMALRFFRRGFRGKRPSLSDQEIAKAWRQFHLAHMKIRLVDRSVNSSMGNRGEYKKGQST